MARPQMNKRSSKLAARKNQAFNSLVIDSAYQTVPPRGPRCFHRARLSQPSLAGASLNAPSEGS
jgi:hypothetical protein